MNKAPATVTPENVCSQATGRDAFGRLGVDRGGDRAKQGRPLGAPRADVSEPVLHADGRSQIVEDLDCPPLCRREVFAVQPQRALVGREAQPLVDQALEHGVHQHAALHRLDRHDRGGVGFLVDVEHVSTEVGEPARCLALECRDRPLLAGGGKRRMCTDQAVELGRPRIEAGSDGIRPTDQPLRCRIRVGHPGQSLGRGQWMAVEQADSVRLVLFDGHAGEQR